MISMSEGCREVLNVARASRPCLFFRRMAEPPRGRDSASHTKLRASNVARRNGAGLSSRVQPLDRLSYSKIRNPHPDSAQLVRNRDAPAFFLRFHLVAGSFAPPS